jgi:dihydrofolate reductase
MIQRVDDSEWTRWGCNDMSELTAPSTLSESLDWANTRLAAGDAIEALPAVKGDSDVPMWTMGSVSLVRNLAAAGLVDRLRLRASRWPAGAPGAKRIFGEGKLEHFELEQTRVLDARVVLLEYRTTN